MPQNANTLSQIAQGNKMVDGYGPWMAKKKYTLFPAPKFFAIWDFGYPWTWIGPNRYISSINPLWTGDGKLLLPRWILPNSGLHMSSSSSLRWRELSFMLMLQRKCVINGWR
jgi:hypothetical protein